MARRGTKRARNRRQRDLSSLLARGWLARALYTLVALIAVGELARWVWLGEVSAQWRIYLLPPLWVLAGLSVQRRAWVAVAASALATLLALWPSWPLLRSVSGAPGHGPSLTVATLGLDEQRIDSEDLSRWLRQVEPDVLVLTGVRPGPDNRIRGRSGYRAFTTRSVRGKAITLLVRLPVTQRPVRQGDSAVRMRFAVDGCPVSFTAVSAPSAWNATQSSARRELFEQLEVDRDPHARVWVGDFGGDLAAPGPRDLMRRGRLRDSRLGLGRHATWPASLGPLGIARDHVLVGGWVAVRERHSGPALRGAPRRPAVAELQLTAPHCELRRKPETR